MATVYRGLLVNAVQGSTECIIVMGGSTWASFGANGEIIRIADIDYVISDFQADDDVKGPNCTLDRPYEEGSHKVATACLVTTP